METRCESNRKSTPIQATRCAARFLECFRGVHGSQQGSDSDLLMKVRKQLLAASVTIVGSRTWLYMSVLVEPWIALFVPAWLENVSIHSKILHAFRVMPQRQIGRADV